MLKPKLFDPFGDFATAGYLQNAAQEKDPQNIKRFEHNLFEVNIDTALDYLSRCRKLTYADFLKIHHILFGDFYPWAGQDRAITTPNLAIGKGSVKFSHPNDTRLAIEEGLRIGQDKPLMANKFGAVMGFFAYGHPFLDGNGRTMLLVHMELCHRAGFSIEWQRTNKADYLTALTQEIDSPQDGILDAYLAPFKGPQRARGSWGEHILSMKGLSGLDEDNQIDGDLSDPAVAAEYKQFEQQRNYTYTTDLPMTDPQHTDISTAENTEDPPKST